MKLVEYFVKQSKVITLFLILVVVYGVFIFINGRKEAFPPFVINQVVITTLYPGASARTVENLITYPMEAKLKGITGIEKVESSTRESISIISVTISPEYEDKLGDIKNDIKARIDEVNLPSGTQLPKVATFDESLIPVVRVLIAGGKDEFERRRIADAFESEIQEDPGVGGVVKEGYRKSEIKVECNPINLQARGLTIDEVISAIRFKNVNIPSGQVYRNGKEYLVRVRGDFFTAEEIGNIVVRANEDYQVIRVKDVAVIRNDFERATVYPRANGKQGIQLLIQKNKLGDSIKVADAVKKLAAKFEKRYFGVTLLVYNDTSVFIKDRLNVLSSNAFQGTLLVVLILFLFFDFWTSVFTVIGIPIAFTGAMILADRLGITLNLMSMFGFIIVVGMIVDNSIVIAENITQKRDAGVDKLRAVTEGTTEVFWPVLVSSLTTIAAFIPLLMIQGVIGKFFAVIPIVVSLTLVISFLQAFIGLPGNIYSSKIEFKGLTKKTEMFQKLKDAYAGLLRKVLHFRWVSLLVFVLMFAVIVGGLGRFIPFQFSPGRVSEFTIQIDMDSSFNLDESERAVILLENEIMKDKKLVQDVITTVGTYGDGRGAIPGENKAGLRIVLMPNRPQSFDAALYKKELQNMTAAVKGVKTFTVQSAIAGPPVSKPIELLVTGDNLDQLYKAATEIKNYVAAISNTTDVRMDFEPGKSELVIDIDDARSSSVRLSATDVAATVRNSFDGGIATTIKQKGDDINVRVKYDAQTSASLSALKYLKVQNRQGKNINFNQIGKIEVKPGISEIRHYNGRTVIPVIGNLENPLNRDYSGAKINKMIKDRFGNNPEEFPGIIVQYSGENADVQKTVRDLGIAFLIALALIFIQLVGLFKNYSQTLIIMLTIPFGLIGVYLGLFINRVPLSYTSLIGIVSLSGVVVNNAIVMIDFINTRIKDGLAPIEAVIDGAASRLRPIILTSITTIVGLLPMAYGWGGSEELLQPLGIVIVWGVGFATLLTLVLVPILYSLIEITFKREYGVYWKERVTAITAKIRLPLLPWQKK